MRKYIVKEDEIKYTVKECETRLSSLSYLKALINRNIKARKKELKEAKEEAENTCRDCGKSTNGTFHFRPLYHGICQECHSKFGRQQQKPAEKTSESKLLESLEPKWQEYFYKDDLNIAISFSKKFFQWTVINMPDFSYIVGWKRKVINIGLIFFALYLSAMLLFEGITIIGMLLRIVLIAIVTSVLYSKTIAFILLKYLEYYQKFCRKKWEENN